MYTISADTTQLQEMMAAIKNLKPAQMERVFVRAINRTATMARTEIVRRIKESVHLRTGVIRDKVWLYEADSVQEGARITISHKRISLIEFGAKQKKKRGGGVTYEISENQGQKMIASSFINRGIGGTKAVFIRKRGVWLKDKLGIVFSQTGKLSRKKWGRDYSWFKEEDSERRVPRYPIDLLRGPSLWQIMVGRENLIKEVVENAKQRLNKHVWDQIDLIAGGVRYAPNRAG